MFDARFARRRARRYRKKGLDRTAQRMVDLLENDTRGATVLEIGGGVGEIGLEGCRPSRRGSRDHPGTLARLRAAGGRQAIDEAGVTGRVHRQLVDIAAAPDAVEQAEASVRCCTGSMTVPRLRTPAQRGGRSRADPAGIQLPTA